MTNAQDTNGDDTRTAPAEIGLAQAVLGWRRPDSDGFEVVARAAIASQLHCLPAVGCGDE